MSKKESKLSNKQFDFTIQETRKKKKLSSKLEGRK